MRAKSVVSETPVDHGMARNLGTVGTLRDGRIRGRLSRGIVPSREQYVKIWSTGGVDAPRSVLLRSVLECLRDHPHDDTASGVATWLGWASVNDVEVALQALHRETLVMRAGEHWQLTRAGWRAAGSGSTEG
jgi:hypothetical protein